MGTARTKIFVTGKNTEPNVKKGKTTGAVVIPKGNDYEQVNELVSTIKAELHGVQKADTYVVLDEIDNIIMKGKASDKDEDTIYQEVDTYAKEKAGFVQAQVPQAKALKVYRIIEKHPRKYAKFITRFKFNTKPVKDGLEENNPVGGTKGQTKGITKEEFGVPVQKKVNIINPNISKKGK